MKKITIEQRSPEWEQMRKTHLTGTMVKDIMGTPRARQEAMYEAIANRLILGIESDGDYENAMDRGTRLEPDAIAAFEFETGKSIEKIGFIKHSDVDGIAQSPDGYINDSNDTEALEIKCMGAKNHIKLWLANDIPSEYLWQTVQYFVVNQNLKKLYFVGYNPQIPVHPIHIIEVKREDIDKLISQSEEEQKKFLNEVNTILSTLIKF